MILSPSLLSADCGDFAGALRDLEAAGLRWVHWDVMDGRFVPNITFGQHVIRGLRGRSSLFFDVHLMIEEPERYLADFREAGADMLVVHAEAVRHLQRVLAEIRRLGMRAGVALNPATAPEVLEYVLDDVDMVLIMSVNPGFGGQKFLPSTFFCDDSTVLVIILDSIGIFSSSVRRAIIACILSPPNKRIRSSSRDKKN